MAKSFPWWRRVPEPSAEPEVGDFEAERKIIEAGRQAKQLLTCGVLDDVRDKLTGEWAYTAPSDSLQREIIHAELRAVARVARELQARANELAKRGIEE